ncbi:MAG: sulfotransferase domain-containing protein [Chloroflexota bacterium]
MNQWHPLEKGRALARRGKQLAVNPVIQAATGLEAMGSHQANDIFIVGYPKSGNTWFQNLVSGVVYGTNPQFTPETLISELVPDVHKKRFYKRFRTPMFYKSHAMPQETYKRVVYLLRDGRDAMVSYFHYLNGWREREVDFLEMVESGQGLMYKWHAHTEAWLANPYNADILTIKYENLKRDTVHELERFVAFANIERNVVWLEQVAKDNEFKKMQAKEKAGDYFDASMDLANKQFFRRGIVGSYKDEMPPEVLAAFLHDAQATLQRCGYAAEGVGKTAVSNMDQQG